MGAMVFFTENYQDRSTKDGYQFEFYCNRCGNGYRSSFQRSAAGFGGRLVRLGSVIGGNADEIAPGLDWDAEWVRAGLRGLTPDNALAKAVEEIKPHFNQCHRCGHWVCGQICWDGERGTCATCGPKVDREVAGMQAAEQIERLTAKLLQLDAKIQQQNWLGATAPCPACRGESGGGKFCQLCGAPLASSSAAAGSGAGSGHCANCGTALGNAKFCGECGVIAR